MQQQQREDTMFVMMMSVFSALFFVELFHYLTCHHFYTHFDLQTKAKANANAKANTNFSYSEQNMNKKNIDIKNISYL